MSEIPKIKGRGAQFNSLNKFRELSIEYDEEFAFGEEENFRSSKTKYLVEHPKKVVNTITSPDLRNGKSVNPYQGCEHGCIYCYARNTHEYFGYSAGLEFEQNIIVKKNAPELLEKEFNRKNWKSTPILFSGNTDCYQPAEKKFELTRRMLEICLKYQNPVAIITKNALVLRDIDLLQRLSEKRLIKVIISITSLKEELRRNLEPRTVSGQKRLQILQKLSSAGIPSGVNIAPIIPGLNDNEIPAIAKASAESGAGWIAYTVVRLNGSIGQLFEDWIFKAYPHKAEKVLNQIKEMHGGKLNDSDFGRRMRGEGKFAQHIKQLFAISNARYFKDKEVHDFDFNAFQKPGQLKLF
ncbi:PA0069 family radical SAM protein [Jiulongibacter sediminis]|uniref:Radical SAM protein n=1 Tax=Jiulongibacter sediminis TaxID=1605367 RepID=A0A0P7BMY6_9BACT|nr:PA0069 family radical SAM protein [Jiulongibacter sediminis]KPM46689.1 radical SAM protein [Jiulongibacter sediminis]TBX21594.1 radical SAM protein [Jiulongibacter sediminis]